MGCEEMRFVKEAFESNYIAPIGPQVDEFERVFAEYVGIKHCAAEALGAIYQRSGIRDQGSEKDRDQEKTAVRGQTSEKDSGFMQVLVRKHLFFRLMGIRFLRLRAAGCWPRMMRR